MRAQTENMTHALKRATPNNGIHSSGLTEPPELLSTMFHLIWRRSTTQKGEKVTYYSRKNTRSLCGETSHSSTVDMVLLLTPITL